MTTFTDVLKGMGWIPYEGCQKYSRVGKTYYTESDDYNGTYWYYETDQFIIDIHDLFIKREYTSSAAYPDMKPYMLLISTYIKSANGECFNPYQVLSSNTMLVMDMNCRDIRLLLHSNFPFVRVGINFKAKMIEEYISCHLGPKFTDISNLFFETREFVTKPIEKLANSIINCRMTSPAAEIFLEAKAKEWLSITLDAYFNKVKSKPISHSDENAIQDVASYINDHYALNISQELLERIAMMSGTKLKQVFKQKYQMSITEYTQRKRMNIAETLLSTTGLEIKDVAKSVGYSSHSRFTTLFKKYKGVYPRDVRNPEALAQTFPIDDDRVAVFNYAKPLSRQKKDC